MQCLILFLVSILLHAKSSFHSQESTLLEVWHLDWPADRLCTLLVLHREDFLQY